MNAPTGGAVVIGVGNPQRRDDGVGPAVAARVAALGLPGVAVYACITEPAALIDAWAGAGVAVLIDAAVGAPPGRVRRCTLADLGETGAVSTHDLNLVQTHELARALDRAPAAVSVIAVGVADTGYGEGLSPAVAGALGEAQRAVLDILRQAQTGLDVLRQAQTGLDVLRQPQEAVDQQP